MKESSKPANRLIDLSLQDVMHQSMMPYAEYVIMERALPRVEDGLKPVQRRVLYTMLELGLYPDRPHRKSARIVGDTLGKYHPHGDTSVYDAMVRMAQDFNLREPLVNGHGNFGSIDGDSAAAMRYTEARLTPLAMELLKDIEKNTVDFSLNFDDTLKEPDMLPGRFPNLLVNGASGIAVGLATNIPPHNLGEVIDGVIAQIDNPNITLSEMMKFVKAPDFPTGGYLVNNEEITLAYETGRGKLTVRAKTHIEDQKNGKTLIVIDELPYQVNKASLLEKILKLSEDKKIIFAPIADIRDESDRNGMRAVIELRKGANAERILAYLLKYSDLQMTFGVNIVAIADGKPQQMGLLQINEYYIKYQKKVVTRRTEFERENARKREHILAGLLIAVLNIDKIIALIRSSKTPKEAHGKLMAEFSITDIQAQAILDLRLQRLTGLEITALQKEHDEVVKLIKSLEEILGSERKLMSVIKEELLEIKKKYANSRRTTFVKNTKTIELEALEEHVEEAENVYVMLTGEGRLKRISAKSGIQPSSDPQPVLQMINTDTLKKVYAFTNLGNMFLIDVKQIPQSRWTEKGTAINSIVPGLLKNEILVSIADFSDISEEDTLFIFTKQGLVKKTLLKEYDTIKSKIVAIKLKEGDSVLAVCQKKQEDNILLVTKNGMSICFDAGEVPVAGRSTQGVIGVRLESGDEVLFAEFTNGEGEILVISDRGYAKKSFAFEYEPQGRGGKGVKTFDFKKNMANGQQLTGALIVKEPYDILVTQQNGETTKMNTEEILIEQKASKGSPALMVLMDNIVTSVTKCI